MNPIVDRLMECIQILSSVVIIIGLVGAVVLAGWSIWEIRKG